MAQHRINARGLRRPQPVIQLAALVAAAMAGDVVEVVGDDPRLELDLRKWVARSGASLTALNRNGEIIWAQIQL